jgi:predicted phage-related endonuclease
MLGLDTFDNYPTHLLTKYSKTRLLQPLNNVDSNDKAIMENLVVIRDQIKELEYQKKNLEEHIKNKFDIGIFVDDTYEVKVNEYTKAGGYDIDAILLDYPNIDINKYKKPDIVYRTINTKMNKKKTTE